MGAGAVAAAGLITLLRTLPTIVGALSCRLQKPAPGQCRHSQAAAHRRRLIHAHRRPRLARAHPLHVLLSSLQARSRRVRRHAAQPGRRAAGRRLRISFCHRQLAHRRPHRQLRQPHVRHGHRHPHGHLRHLPGRGLDGPRLRRSRHHHRRHGRHRRGQRRRHLAGPQDRLPRRLHAALCSSSRS